MEKTYRQCLHRFFEQTEKIEKHLDKLVCFCYIKTVKMPKTARRGVQWLIFLFRKAESVLLPHRMECEFHPTRRMPDGG